MRGIATTLHCLDGAPLVRDVSPKKECSVVLVRYADDVVAGLGVPERCRTLLAEMREQAEKFGLSLQPHKRRLIEFGVMRLDIGRREVLESWKRSTFWVAATPDGPGPDVSQATGREGALKRRIHEPIRGGGAG